MVVTSHINHHKFTKKLTLTLKWTSTQRRLNLKYWGKYKETKRRQLMVVIPPTILFLKLQYKKMTQVSRSISLKVVKTALSLKYCWKGTKRWIQKKSFSHYGVQGLPSCPFLLELDIKDFDTDITFEKCLSGKPIFDIHESLQLLLGRIFPCSHCLQLDTAAARWTWCCHPSLPSKAGHFSHEEIQWSLCWPV